MMDFIEEKDFMVALQAQKLMPRETPFDGNFILVIVLSGAYEPQLNYRKPSLDSEKINSLHQAEAEIETIAVEKEIVLKMPQEFELIGFDFVPSCGITPVVRRIAMERISAEENSELLDSIDVPFEKEEVDEILNSASNKTTHISYDSVAVN